MIEARISSGRGDVNLDPALDPTGTAAGDVAPADKRFGGLRLAVGVAVGLVLAWLVVVRGLPVALGERWPDVALTLYPRSPQALLAKAQALRQQYYKIALATDETKHAGGATGGGAAQRDGPPATAVDLKDIEQRQAEIRSRLRTILKRVIRGDPLNAVAFRMFGEIETDTRRARAYMDAALARSKREPVAVFWLLNDALARKDRVAALEYAEVLFRTNPPLRRYAIASFAQLAGDNETAGKLAERLREKPWWRRAFFNMLPDVAPDPRSPLNVMLALKAVGDRPTGEEIAHYLRTLFRRQRFGLAYYAWLNLLPTEKMAKMGLLNNGDFDDDSDGEPFNWHFTAHENATVGLLPAPGAAAGNKALHVSLEIGRVRFPEVRQYMKLPPGRYVLSGQYRGRIKSGRGLIWEAMCVAKDGRMHAIGATEPIAGIVRHWSSLSFSFEFDEAQACELVLLRLRHPARTQSERFIDGEIWFDEFKLAALPVERALKAQ
jgi:hypothetical protein